MESLPCFIGIVVLSLVVLGKVFYIQRVQGAYWKGLSDSLHQKFIELDAERGTIYSEDSSMLSTSIPYFNIYIDFGADGLREKNGRRFTENVDSLSLCLSRLFGDQSAAAYKKSAAGKATARQTAITSSPPMSLLKISAAPQLPPRPRRPQQKRLYRGSGK
jgi:cell division protein FtsI/penicillin-binding protein 2